MSSNIRNHRNHGVYIEFANGNNISTIWGVGSYGSNYYYPEEGKLDFSAIPDDQPAETVEVLFNCGDKLKKRLHKKFDGDGQVIGYLTIEQWLYVVSALANEKKDTIHG